MGFAGSYLAKRTRVLRMEVPFEGASPEIIVVIPCFSEPGVTQTLLSLKKAAERHRGTEVIPVVNWPEKAGKDTAIHNIKIYRELQEWAKVHSCSHFRVYPFCFGNLPAKESGAGPARRIAMDLAVRRFSMDGNNRGIIVSTDADALFDSEYLGSISRCFADERVNTASVYFEHPLEGEEYPPTVYDAVAQYELYLRCYIQSLRFSGHPFAFHTIGSSFAVRASAYVKQGGMNSRKAGEDFYFLQKMMLLGGYAEINSTRVVPSPRISVRVPFGTGPAVKRLSAPGAPLQQMYACRAFGEIRSFLLCSEALYRSNEKECYRMISELPLSIRSFLLENGFMEALEEMKGNSSAFDTFLKRFYSWFNGFRVFKYLNHAHKGDFKKIPVTEAAAQLAGKYGIKASASDGVVNLLKIFRRLQREKEYYLE